MGQTLLLALYATSSIISWREKTLSSSFSNEETEAAKRLKSLPKVTQLVGGKSIFEPNSTLIPTTCCLSRMQHGGDNVHAP